MVPHGKPLARWWIAAHENRPASMRVAGLLMLAIRLLMQVIKLLMQTFNWRPERLRQSLGFVGLASRERAATCSVTGLRQQFNRSVNLLVTGGPAHRQPKSSADL